MSLVKPALTRHAERQLKSFQRSHKGQQKYVGASEIGMCMRRVFYSKLKLQPVDRKAESWGASRRGSTFEEHFWVPAMRAFYGKNLLYTGKQQITRTCGPLRATPDGLLINQPRNALQLLGVDDIGKTGEIVVECKTADPRINLATAKPEHEFQAQIQMALLRVTTKHRPNYAVISYTNASFFDDVIEFAIKFDPAIYEVAKTRATTVLTAKAPEDLAPEGWIAGGNECRYCPFTAPCQQLRGASGQTNIQSNMDAGLAEKIVTLAREERDWHTRAGMAETEQRDLQYQIKELLRAHGLQRIDHDGIVVVWSPVKGRPALDLPH